LKISKITLKVDTNFRRSYSVIDSSGDSVLKTGEIYRIKFNDKEILKNHIDFGENYTNRKMIKINIKNADDQPLNIKEINEEIILDKIVFEDNGSANYKLYFGNPKAEKPQYEIENFKDYIDKEKNDEIKLGEIKNYQIDSKADFDYKLIFNIVIVLVSIILIVLLVLRIFRK